MSLALAAALAYFLFEYASRSKPGRQAAASSSPRSSSGVDRTSAPEVGTA
ncbi:MAG: hypothetical protein M3Z00_02705 [Actinomycetota bacterium]|nr:hypothetical protein [Actinomycetota bacterium]